MQDQESPPRYPRDKDELLRDLTLIGRLKDIRDQAALRDRLAPKWWEALIGIIQFAAALGLLASLIQHPLLREDPYARLVVFWGGLMILALVLGFEFVILCLHNLRRVNDLTTRRLEDAFRRIEELENEKNDEYSPARRGDTE